MQGDAGADGDLIADDHGGRAATRRLEPASFTPASAKARRAGSTATPAWPLVSAWPSWASKASIVAAPAKAAPAGDAAAAVEQQPGGGPPARRPIWRTAKPVRDLGQSRPAARRGDAEKVEDAASAPARRRGSADRRSDSAWMKR